MKQQIAKHLCAIALISSVVCCVSSRAATEPTTTKAPTTETKNAADANIEYSKVVEGYSLQASAKETYAPSEAISLDVTLKNVGADGTLSHYYNPLLDYDISVLLPDGKAAPLTLYGVQESQQSSFFSRIIAGYFKAGSEDKDKIQLNRYFDMTLHGVYTVSFGKSVYKRQGDPLTESKVNGITRFKHNIVKVFSNVIKITVQ